MQTDTSNFQEVQSTVLEDNHIVVLFLNEKRESTVIFKRDFIVSLEHWPQAFNSRPSVTVI